MFKKLALATALLAGLSTAHYYQFEINGGYENTYFENNLDGFELDSDGDLFFVNGKYYLNTVNTKNAPLAEAAFLNKASNIGLGYVNAQNELSEAGINAEEEFEIIGVNGEFFIPNSQFYISGSLNQVDYTASARAPGFTYDESDDTTGYSLEAGYLPVNGLLLALGVAKESVDPMLASKIGFASTLGYGVAVGEDTAVSLRAKYVTQIGNHFTNFEGVTYFGDETAYRLAADLYIDPTLSVGVSFADSTADESDTIFSVRTQKFFTPAFAVGVNYTTTDGADSYGINGTFRF